MTTRRRPGAAYAVSAETATIAYAVEYGAYGVFLEELPWSGTPPTLLTIGGVDRLADQVTTAPAQPGQWRIFYSGQRAGFVECHPADDGATLVIDYAAQGANPLSELYAMAEGAAANQVLVFDGERFVPTSLSALFDTVFGTTPGWIVKRGTSVWEIGADAGSGGALFLPRIQGTALTGEAGAERSQELELQGFETAARSQGSELAGIAGAAMDRAVELTGVVFETDRAVELTGTAQFSEQGGQPVETSGSDTSEQGGQPAEVTGAAPSAEQSKDVEIPVWAGSNVSAESGAAYNQSSYYTTDTRNAQSGFTGSPNAAGWWTATDVATPQWASIQFTAARVLKALQLSNHNNGAMKTAKNVKVQASADGTNWVDIAYDPTKLPANFSAVDTYYFQNPAKATQSGQLSGRIWLLGSTAYAYWRVYINSNWADGTHYMGFGDQNSVVPGMQVWE